VVISQVYGGGGNSGATLKNDFIELHNIGTASVDLSSWSVQYASATGSSWSKTNLVGSIAPGGYYLVQEAKGSGGTVDLPTPEATGSLAMSGTAGKVALVSSQTALTSSCPLSGVVDFVGFGGANCYEGSAAAPLLTNTTAAIRAGSGCTDTDSNVADFTSGAPSPRNSASAAVSCAANTPVSVTTSTLSAGNASVSYSATLAAKGGSWNYTWTATSGLPANGLSLSPAGVISGIPTAAATMSITVKAADAIDGANFGTKTLSLTIGAAPTCSPTATISGIQGSGLTSPLVNTAVVTTGIVTVVKSGGFFIQAPDSDVDADPNTSEGVYVYSGSTPGVRVGDKACVSGTVKEYYQTAGGPTMTEIGTPTVIVLSSANPMPTPVVISAAATEVNDLNNLEKYEGMLVKVPSLTVVAPTDGYVNETTATGTSNGLFFGVVTGVARPFREAGVQLGDTLPATTATNIPRFDLNPERLRIDSTSGGGTAINVAAGATVTNLVGALDYAYRTNTIAVAPGFTPSIVDNVVFTPAPASSSGQVSVAGFNMQRFFNTVNDGKSGEPVLSQAVYSNRLAKASLAIRQGLNMPDILGVMEVETIATLNDIAAKVNADAGSANPGYVAYLVEGNDVGGIDVGFLVKSSRVKVLDVTQYGKDTTYDDPSTSTPPLLNDRPPLLLRADVTKPGSATALRLTVIANHLRSLSNVDDATDGARVRAKRKAQAEYLAKLIQTRQTADPNENIVALGDFNAYEVNDGYVDVIGTVRGTPTAADQVVTASADLVNPDLSLLSETLVPAQRYSYSYDGNAQSLDHMLASAKAMTHFAAFQIARLNSDFPETYRGDFSRPERLSDHDPEVAYFTLPETANVTSLTTISATGLGYNRVTKLYTGTVTVKNKSASAIAGPVYLFFDALPTGVTLTNAAGTAAGIPYIVVSSANLAAGASSTVSVKFTNSGATSMTYTPRIVAGSL
jgi:predicted extracellular nuclease